MSRRTLALALALALAPLLPGTAPAEEATTGDPWQGLRGSEAATPAPRQAPKPEAGPDVRPDSRPVARPVARPPAPAPAAALSGSAPLPPRRPAVADAAQANAAPRAPAPAAPAAPVATPAAPSQKQAAAPPAPVPRPVNASPDGSGPNIAGSKTAGAKDAGVKDTGSRPSPPQPSLVPPTSPRPAPAPMPVLAGGPEAPPPYAPPPEEQDTRPSPSATTEPTAPAGPAAQAEQHAAPHGPTPAASAAPLPGGRTIAPVVMVRRLQRLQDAIAGGFAEGIPQQRALIAEMDEAFGAADPATWQDPKNARAIVMYFLSGGSPAVLRAIVMREPKPNIDEKLLVGSLLYLEGREDAALRELGEVDARKLPNGLAGQVALAQAALSVRADPVRSASLLELARLFLPGTLVDEAALRRSVLVAAQAGDMATFERLATQYFHRFRHSAYAGNFRQRFAAALTRMSALSEPEGLKRLDALLAPLDEAAQREVFLLVARAAILEGKTKLATASAQRALARAPQASSDAERARVYLSAADAATPDRFQSAAAQLKAVDRDRLDASDKALLEAASRTADLVRRADEAVPQPTPAVAPQQATAPVPQSVSAAPGEQKASPALVKAQTKLQQIDQILKEAPR